jgi:hypothetical protein
VKPIVIMLTVEVERLNGPFASRDELTEQVRDSVENADPGSLFSEAGSEYEVVSWGVEAA